MTDGVAPGAVARVTALGVPMLSGPPVNVYGEWCYVRRVYLEGGEPVAECESVWNPSLKPKVRINEYSVELVAPPVSAGEASHGA